MKRIYPLLFISFLLFAFNACKKQKGCTDRNSLNYDVNAEEDDGSCKYCDSTITPVASQRSYLFDTYSPSIHYYDTISILEFTQHIDTFNYEQCGTTGCYIDLKIISVINENMRVSFQISSSGPYYINYYSNLNILGHETKSVSKIASQTISNCVPITNAAISAYIQTYVVYY